jgi:hypothetical protein
MYQPLIDVGVLLALGAAITYCTSAISRLLYGESLLDKLPQEIQILIIRNVPLAQLARLATLHSLFKRAYILRIRERNALVGHLVTSEFVDETFFPSRACKISTNATKGPARQRGGAKPTFKIPLLTLPKQP